jgi:hypothetical protein
MTILDPRTAAFTFALASLAAACSSSSGSSNDNSAAGDEGGTVTLPTIAITSPASAAAVTVMMAGGADVVPISFTTTGITLMMPGSCPNHSDSIDNCGHVHLYIDGHTACLPMPGAPYNNATPATAAADGAGASPVNAILSSCATVNGPHTVSLELHHDDHSPIIGADGMVISAQVMLTVSGG